MASYRENEARVVVSLADRLEVVRKVLCLHVALRCESVDSAVGALRAKTDGVPRCDCSVQVRLKLIVASEDDGSLVHLWNDGSEATGTRSCRAKFADNLPRRAFAVWEITELGSFRECVCRAGDVVVAVSNDYRKTALEKAHSYIKQVVLTLPWTRSHDICYARTRPTKLA